MGDRLATIDMDRKLGRAVPLWGGGAGSPSNTLRPRTRPTCTLSFILIHPTVWPQYTNVTDRTERRMVGWSLTSIVSTNTAQRRGQTDRQDNGPIAYGEPVYKRSPKKNLCTFFIHGTLLTFFATFFILNFHHKRKRLVYDVNVRNTVTGSHIVIYCFPKHCTYACITRAHVIINFNELPPQ